MRRQKRNRKWRTKTFLVDDKSAVMQCIIITFYARLPWILIDRLTFINVNWLTNCRSSKHNKEIEIDWHDTIKKKMKKKISSFSAQYMLFISRLPSNQLHIMECIRTYCTFAFSLGSLYLKTVRKKVSIYTIYVMRMTFCVSHGVHIWCGYLVALVLSLTNLPISVYRSIAFRSTNQTNWCLTFLFNFF